MKHEISVNRTRDAIMAWFAVVSSALSCVAAPTLQRVQTARVAVSNDAVAKNIPGCAVAIKSLDVLPQVEGVVIETLPGRGAPVKSGDLLCRLDDTRYRAKVLRAEAKVEGCEIRLRNAKRNYDRRNALAQRGVSAEEVENALGGKELAAAELKSAQADLALANAELGACRILSPMDGVVAAVKKSAGDKVSSSSVLLTIVQTSPMLVCFSLSGSEYLRMFSGDDGIARSNAVIRLTLSDGTSYPEEGEVCSVDSVMDSQTDSLRLYAKFPNAKGILRSGAFVSVMLTDRRPKKMPSVPVSAVSMDAKGPYVWIVDDSGVVSRRAIKCGRIVGKMRHVLEGLCEGERVVVGDVRMVSPGQKVETFEMEPLR